MLPRNARLTTASIVLLVGSLILLASTPVAAQEGNAELPFETVLSPEEIAEGWIQLFDGRTSFGWTVEGADDGGNVLTFDNKIIRNPSDEPLVLRHGCRFGAGQFLATVEVIGGDGTRAQIRFGQSTTTVPIGGVHSMKVQHQSARGDLTVQIPPRTDLVVEELAFKPQTMEPLFDGKSLQGWNVLPDGKSVYSVTDEGWLNVKDGRGDIQTAEQFDDFLLQLQVYSNGEHLNSGIFFRALPGQFWSGYESQIRNQWEGDDRTRPVDYGTGGIYRRQPARLVNADDFTWFTKTIVAHENHLAVWVNGIQVSDWNDTRDPSDNARNGRKDGPGVISIQGHDPTTDLSFRNIRIQRLEDGDPSDK